MITPDDELTGLRSRRNMLSLLQRQVMLSSERRMTLGLLIIDIDNFSRINAVHGYDCGDQVLRHVAAQLRVVARGQDYIGRIGDDRFVLLLTNVMNAGHVELAARKLFRQLDLPLQTGQARLHVPVTVGAALCPTHSTHPTHLLRRAEAALELARASGTKLGFPPETTGLDEISDLWDLEMQLGDAIERGEIVMHYQPQVRAGDEQAVGAEALMRWASASRGDVAPSVFIPIAERTGQIKKLTIWALNTALRHASEWPAGRRYSVSVNLPGVLASQPDLPEIVEGALQLWGTPGVQLILEITEGTLMDTAVAFPVLERIRALGVQVAIDDFGTGYSCLAYFRNIPVDELKIDRSFVGALMAESASADIVNFIVQLAHRFGLRVAAEGVENAATRDALVGLGCDILQGYFYSRSMTSAEFSNWLAQRALTA